MSGYHTLLLPTATLLLRKTSIPHLSSFHHHFHRASLVSEKFSVTAMENLPQPPGKAYATDGAEECLGKESCEMNANKRVSDQIMPHILNLYGACAKASDFEIYAPNASFEDPLVHARGVQQIKSSFYSLSKVFGESRIVEYTLQENEIGPRKKEILIDNKQHYKFLGKAIAMTSLIKLYVEDGKIIRHEDLWDKKPLRNRDTVGLPLLGRMLEIVRRGSMLATHAMMGFGKDPKPDHS